MGLMLSVYLHLLKEIQQQARLTLIFVTHDFGIVAQMCDWVAVMYAGNIVEMATTRELFNYPLHPYTSALMESVPKVEMKVAKLVSIEGQPPLYSLPAGCSFAPRCNLREERCRSSPPEVKVRMDHRVRCWKYAQG